MDTSPRLYFRYVWFLFAVCCEICRGNLIATNVTGYGGDTTVFTCSSPDISPGVFYTLTKDGTAIYRASDQGNTLGEKYNAAAEVGQINLNILNTNISDAGEYTCNHNFIDASGTVSVAFRPENVIATTSQLQDMWQISVSAYKVFPLESNITGASCLRPDNTVAVFQRENQVVNTNNEEKYLYDIFWNGKTNRTWSGDVQCNITIVVIDTIVRTINVSFQAEPDSTSEQITVGGIIGILLFVVFVVCIAIVIICSYKKKKFCFKEDKKKIQERNGKHNDDKSNSSVSRVKMDIMSTEKSDVDHKELSRNNDGETDLFPGDQRTPINNVNPSPDARQSQRPQSNPPTPPKSETDQDPVTSIGTRSNGKPEGDQRSGVPYENVLSKFKEDNNQLTSQTQPQRLVPIEFQPAKRKKKGKSKRLEP